MADDTSSPPHSSEGAALPGEWLFKAGGEVFGPVTGAVLVGMIWERRVGPATPVAGGDGAWCPLAEVPGALVHLGKAEARARVEADLRRVRRGALLRRAGVAVAALAVVAAVSWLAAARPWRARSALLDDLGPGIELGPVRVGSARRTATPEEIAIPATATAASRLAVPARPSAPRGAVPPAPERAGRGELEPGDLVLAQYDVRGIEQAVARQRGSLAPCLRDEAQRSPDFSGEIPIEFAVGNDGKVAALWVEDPRFKSGPLRDCLLRKLDAWSFDPFPGQRPVVSLSFRIGSR